MSDADIHTARFTGYDVVRVLLGVVLLTAAGLKGHQLATEPVVGTGLVDSRWFLIGVVEFGLLFGLMLLAGIFPKSTWIVALACFACFAVASAVKAVSGDASCGCFGKVPVNPWHTLGIDLAAIVALVRWQPPRVKPRYGVREFASLRSRLMGSCTLCLAAGIPAGFAMGTYQAASVNDAGGIVGDGEFVLLEPETWVGKRFPLLEHIDGLGYQLAQGEWLVVLSRHDCPRCRAAIPEHEQLARSLSEQGGSRRLALIEAPPHGENERLPHASYVRGRLPGAVDWVFSAPLKVHISGGKVTKVGQHSEGASGQAES